MSEPFDFDAFISGTQLARRTVSAYRVRPPGEIERLTARARRDPRRVRRARVHRAVAPRRISPSRSPTLRAEMEASRVEWTLRTLTPEELRQHIEVRRTRRGRRTTQMAFEQIATMSRPPGQVQEPLRLLGSAEPHRDQWQQIGDVIGAAQWGALYTDATTP